MLTDLFRPIATRGSYFPASAFVSLTGRPQNIDRVDEYSDHDLQSGNFTYRVTFVVTRELLKQCPQMSVLHPDYPNEPISVADARWDSYLYLDLNRVPLQTAQQHLVAYGGDLYGPGSQFFGYKPELSLVWAGQVAAGVLGITDRSAADNRGGRQGGFNL
jgi:hypothetical protein